MGELVFATQSPRQVKWRGEFSLRAGVFTERPYARRFDREDRSSDLPNHSASLRFDYASVADCSPSSFAQS